MSTVVSKVLATVNAPYGVAVAPAQLAARITDPESVATFDSAVFAFLSDVSSKLQQQFISEMGVDLDKVIVVASQFSELAGHKLALAA